MFEMTHADSSRLAGTEQRCRLARRGAVLALAAGAALASSAVVPAAAQGARHVAPGAARTVPARAVAPNISAAQYCAHLPSSAISAVVGSTVKLEEADGQKSNTIECIYFGTVEVLVTRETNIPAADVASRAAAEKTIATGLPKGTKVTFAPLPTLGPNAFTFTAKENGGTFTGAGDNKGTTGYGALISGKPAISKLVSLLKLDFAA